MSALRVRAPSGAGSVLAGAAGALAIGAVVAHGTAVLPLLAVGGLAFALWALERPDAAALWLIALTPFSVYPLTVGGFSVFLVVPLIGFTSLLILVGHPGGLTGRRRRLPLATYAVVIGAALLTTALSVAPTTAGSRTLYLLVAGLFAAALAASLARGRLSELRLAQAVVLAATLAGVAVSLQALIGIAVGNATITNWLVHRLSLFAGAHTAGQLGQINWTVDGVGVVRGIFPFMDAPAAGQFMMLGLVAAVWLRLDPRSRSTPSRRTLATAAVLIIATALLLTFSRQAWVGAFAGLGALALRRRPIAMVIVILALFVVMTVVPAPGGHGTFADYLLSAGNTSTTSSSTRLDLWRQALQLVPHHLLRGVGPGLYETLNPDPANPIYYAHNVWLDELVELGAVGGVALIAMFLLTMRSAYRRSATLGFAMLAAWATANLFDDALYQPRPLILLAVAFALAGAGRGSATARAQARAA